jgi:hypothetical protein
VLLPVVVVGPILGHQRGSTPAQPSTTSLLLLLLLWC